MEPHPPPKGGPPSPCAWKAKGTGGVSPCRRTPFPVRVEGKKPFSRRSRAFRHIPRCKEDSVRLPLARGRCRRSRRMRFPPAGCTPSSMRGDGSPCKGKRRRERRGREPHPPPKGGPPSPCAWKAKSPSPAAREPFGVSPAARKTPYAFPSQGEGVGEADG